MRIIWIIFDIIGLISRKLNAFSKNEVENNDEKNKKKENEKNNIESASKLVKLFLKFSS